MASSTQGIATSSPWHDQHRSPAERAALLLAEMTLEEKLSQLVGLWVNSSAEGDVAPQQSKMTGDVDWDRAIEGGLGQLTRPFGTSPVAPEVGARALASAQRQIMAANRFGIPALVHEECLAGFAAWQATCYPVPPSWGATFDPELVEEMATQIGATMRAAGIHQGLAPVLDVTRDYRWGRVEETIGEDPYLVGTIGTAYVKGLQSTGIVATLKHFAGYSASRAGRNLAPVSMGPRELADVILPPFEMAVREGRVRSVMHSYSEIDGVPAAANDELLTDLLRGEWGFDGVVVADYFGVRFLETQHRVAATTGEAAGAALRAGVDVELPSGDAYVGPLLAEVREGRVSEDLVDRAALRVLTQKAELGLLDGDWSPEVTGPVVLDDPTGVELALRLARQAVVLVENRDHVLPLAAGGSVALVGPLADDPYAMLGCYSFPAHVGVRFGAEVGVEIPTVREALAGRTDVRYARGCDVMDPDTSGFAEAVALAADAEVCVVAVGDRAGLFGRGTSGEGCDATDLRLPGVQAELIEALVATGTPVVVVLLTGRPYALGGLLDGVAGIVQAFFPGQQGGEAIAEILTGEIAPSGRLPLSLPREAGAQPSTYLNPPLGRRSPVSNIDPTPAYAFGHGLSYTSFEWSGAQVVNDVTDWHVDGVVEVSVTVRNTGSRDGAEVVQLYLHDRAAQVTRPENRLIGFARVPLEPGESSTVTFEVPADMTSFTGRRGDRIVEPGDVELRLSRSSEDVVATLPLRLVGTERTLGGDRRLRTTARVEGR
ncbi:glycoside hydrolase family 3 N-terminal domain-containing protein [Pseudactinotalea suaedae]|uniref:beta-xylosidase/alpha-l-arabinosidase n=1 Tax=Pseudactinotalea suaedae TaxID=1524924 RepID=UPI0012E1C2A5|nr:glycoside hydrolase family 3 N-terminal domain-containing protein [Pseudactinotalea suaedae]